MRAFSNEGVMDLAIEVMLLRRKQARGQNQAVQVIKARHMAELERSKCTLPSWRMSRVSLHDGADKVKRGERISR